MTTRPAARPLRRDAAENREKLLQAAVAVFTEHGLDGSVEEVAHAAGVGMGTLYRRFPTKQALVDEIVGGVRRDLLALAQAAAGAEDGTGLEQLLRDAGQLQAAHSGCLQQLWNSSDAEQATMRRFRTLLRELLVAAQRAGRVRPEATGTDIAMILWSVRGVIETTRDVAPTAWRRHLELLVAGLRPNDNGPFATELTERPLSEVQSRRIARAGGTDRPAVR